MSKKKQGKVRNRTAIAAWNQSGAGKHKDRKKEANKTACRKKVDSRSDGSSFLVLAFALQVC